MYVGGGSLKKAKRQELGVDEQVLKDSLIRSLTREADKVFQSGNPTIVDYLRKQVDRAKKEAAECRRKYWELLREVEGKFGTRWRKNNDARASEN